MLGSGFQKIKLSKKFRDACVRIGECKSREEEEQIVTTWMARVKKELGQKKLKISQLYEDVVSLIHLSLLGYNTSFGHIHAVNLTQDTQLMTKALGYLACAALLDSQSSLLILIINSTQRDLSSQQPTAMALALTAICHLVTAELIQPVIGYIGPCLVHPIPIVRLKAVMCVHSFVKKDPSCVAEFFPELVRLLQDPDLSIVNAVVNTFSEMLRCQMNLRQICECLPDIQNVFQIIQNGQARMEYFHQRMLAPFIQLNLFRLFQRMSPELPELAGEIEPIVSFALQNGTVEGSAMASVLYEAIRTCIDVGLTEIPYLPGAISLFMSSTDDNLKYVGLGLLQSLPEFADEFQGIIIDCLEHPDATIRLRTLALLHAMANENNAQIIVINMLKFFQKTKNERVRTELADRITSIASEYSPSPLWFAKTMEQLFALGGEHVKPEVAFAVLRLIDENCDEETRRGIVNLYIDVAQSGRRLSDVFVIVIARIIGSYAELSDEYDLDFIALLLCDLADQYESPRDWVLNALLQIVAKLEEVPHQIPEVFENYKQSRSIIVQEICFEALALLTFKDALAASVAEAPEDWDEDMTFLDEFVADAIENQGMKEYIPVDERGDDDDLTPKAPTLILTHQTASDQVYGADAGRAASGMPGPVEMEESRDQGLNTTGVRTVWGEAGLAQEPEPGVSAGVEAGYTAPVEEKKVSLFQKMAIKKEAKTAESVRKEKMQGSLFGGMKKGGAKKAPAAAPSAKPTVERMERLNAPSSGPYGAPPPESVPPPMGGAVKGLQLTENDFMMLEQIALEIKSPMPEAIGTFAQTGQLETVYEDPQMKVAAMSQAGTILVAVFNQGAQPMMELSMDIVGPQVFKKEVVTHPRELRAIPSGNPVWFLASFRFPPQVSGFPDFKFKLNVQYNGVPVEVELPTNITTFIVPADATTQQFGAFWKQGGSEIVYTMKRTPDLQIDEVSGALNEMLHVKTVQRIGTEEIFIGNLFSTPLRILVHVKFGAEKVDMKVLTKAQPLSQAIVKVLSEIFG